MARSPVFLPFARWGISTGHRKPGSLEGQFWALGSRVDGLEMPVAAAAGSLEAGRTIPASTCDRSNGRHRPPRATTAADWDGDRARGYRGSFDWLQAAVSQSKSRRGVCRAARSGSGSLPGPSIWRWCRPCVLATPGPRGSVARSRQEGRWRRKGREKTRLWCVYISGSTAGRHTTSSFLYGHQITAHRQTLAPDQLSFSTTHTHTHIHTPSLSIRVT